MVSRLTRNLRIIMGLQDLLAKDWCVAMSSVMAGTVVPALILNCCESQ